jgi:hypothetical protein
LAVVGNTKCLFGVFKMKPVGDEVCGNARNSMKKVNCLFKVVVGMVMAVENGRVEGDFLHEKGVSDGNGAPKDSEFHKIATGAGG